MSGLNKGFSDNHREVLTKNLIRRKQLIIKPKYM